MRALGRGSLGLFFCLSLFSFLALAPPARASIAYGSINNFDTVNDTGVECHGFEIEIDDIHSKDITYTYDWNHYGTPKITEDSTDPLHPKVFVRYESAKDAYGQWVAFTAVPAGPISPTDGHQFTNPAVNFGGEHFGVGYYGAPTAVKYNWLIDDGGGNLIHGGAVNIATPLFAYAPPAGGNPAQVQAVIAPPPPPAPPPLEFGEASWVKVTVTSSHNNNKVELRDLVSDDPNDPNDRNWQNGEPDEVEVEWQIIQTDFHKADGGKNGKLEGAPEDLPNGDEVITRRYDFFQYVGPIDQETGEALAESVGPDGIHGSGTKVINGVEVDLSTVVVVGDYIGAQMAGFDAAGQIGLIDHLQDGEKDVPYVERTVVVAGTPPIATTVSGALPEGMTFDTVAGVLSGTPTIVGTSTFTVHSTDAAGGDVTSTFTLNVVDSGIVPPLHIHVTTSVSPVAGGSTSGDGEYAVGTDLTVVATPKPGYDFVSWTDGGTVVSTLASYTFTADVNRELVANFTVHGGLQLPSDANQDNALDLSDAIWVLGHLFQGFNPQLPCEGGTSSSPGAGDLALVDFNGDGAIDLTDPVDVLNYLFLGASPPALGTACIPIVGCAEVCH
jgi:List-Bact-rpt repeat protein/putative Ig domain-containing protein